MRIVVMVMVLLLGGPVLASGNPSNELSQRWSFWFTTHDLQLVPKPAATTINPTNVRSPVSPPATAPADVRLVSRRHTQGTGFLASTAWLTGAYSREPEVASHPGMTAGRLYTSLPGDMGVIGAWGPAGDGMPRRHWASTSGTDQDRKDVWSEWRHDVTTGPTAAGRQPGAGEASPVLARLEQPSGRVGLSWSRPSFLDLHVTYARNAFNSLPDPLGIAPQLKDHHMVEAALGYAGAAWNARLASSYSLETNLLSNGDNRVKAQTMTVAFHPLDVLTIAPTLGYREEQLEWSGVRMESPSVSLAMNYQQNRRLLITALGNYSGMRSSDRVIEMEMVGGKGILAWNVQQSRRWTTVLSVEGAYNRHTNLAVPSPQMEDLSGLLRLMVAPL
jgi:hypothetical protein